MTERAGHVYDVFISYSSADRAWVEGYLLDALTQAGVRCHTEAAFALGSPLIAEIERAILQSRRTLLVLSPAYQADSMSRFADLLAQSFGADTATWPVIPIILQRVDLPPRLSMLVKLDVTDPARWPEAVGRLLADLPPPVPAAPAPPPCPYPGMAPFTEADSDHFYGREAEVQEVVERLRLHPWLAVIGRSGSGKSSLVFAGLLPALHASRRFGSGEWIVRTMRPGATPLTTLQVTIGDVVDLATLQRTDMPAGRLLLIVDQFEEIFAQRGSEADPFQSTLARLAGLPSCYVVLTVRADFFADLLVCPLWGRIKDHRFELLPLDAAGLRQAIVRPAEDVGVYVEAALVERLVADAAGEPGVLPFVQETLALLWEHLERRLLPLRAYEALVLPSKAYGVAPRTGLQVAMARRADAALAALSDAQRIIARRIFLRLVQFGEGRADTRRQQPVEALHSAGDEVGIVDATFQHLAGSRLLTLGSGKEDARTADFAHEALIAGWPTLQEWLQQRRQAELVRRRLEAKAAEWVRLGHAGGGLLDSLELVEAEMWLAGAVAADLGASADLLALVAASRFARKREQRRQQMQTVLVVFLVFLIAPALFVAANLWMFYRKQASVWQPTGLPYNSAIAITIPRQAPDPDSPHICVGTADIGIACSQDLQTWDISQIGLPVGTPALFNNRDAPLDYLAGSTWSTKIAGIEAITFDILNPRRLYAAVSEGKGIYTSRDGGRNWHPLVTEGLMAGPKKQTAIQQIVAYGRDLFVLRTGGDPTLDAMQRGSLHVSRDSGVTWRQVGGPATPTGLLRSIVPTLDTEGKLVGIYGAGETGLFASDAVEPWIWRQLLTLDPDSIGVSVARTDGVAYLATYDRAKNGGAVYRWASEDNALTGKWVEYRGVPRALAVSASASARYSVWLLFDDGRVVAIEHDGRLVSQGSRPAWPWRTAKTLSILSQPKGGDIILLGHSDGLLQFCPNRDKEDGCDAIR